MTRKPNCPHNWTKCGFTHLEPPERSGVFRTVSVMETRKGEFATPLFYLKYFSYICGMIILLLLILFVLLHINKNVHKLNNK